MTSVSGELFEELNDFSGGKLSYVDKLSVLSAVPKELENRPQAYISHKMAQICLNGHDDEEAKVHELLHVKSAWMLENPFLEVKFPNSHPLAPYYGELNNSLDHVIVFREQADLGYPVTKFILEDLKCKAENWSNFDSGAHAVRNVWSTYFFLKFGFFKDTAVYDKAAKIFDDYGIKDAVNRFVDTIWKHRDSVKDMAFDCLQAQVIGPDHARLTIRDIKEEKLIIEEFSNPNKFQTIL